MVEREEDSGLAIEQFVDLNRRFYDSKSGPHRYILMRSRALVLAQSDSELIMQAEREGFNIGHLELKSIGDEVEETDAIDRQNFLVTESTVLLHHSAEALLRLYFAHSGLPGCPWLETARLRSFSVFKRRVAELDKMLDQRAAVADMMEVFTGFKNPESAAKRITPGRWRPHQDALVRLLRTAAQIVLDDGNLYNAAKHGLAVFPGRSQVSFGPSEGPAGGYEPAMFSTEGESIHFLEAVDGGDGKRWRETTRWISAEHNLALVDVIAKQIETLLSVGRARYLQDLKGWRVEGISIAQLDRISASALRNTGSAGIQRMSMTLLYYEPSPVTSERPPTD